jgi:hypothetical protein
MPNVTTLSNLQIQIPFLQDGVAPVYQALLKNIPPDVRASDSLALFTSGTLTNAAVAVKATPGKLHAIAIKSNGALGYLVLWNLAQGGVTVGTTSSTLALPFTATAGHTTTCFFAGSGQGTIPLWSVAITAAVATTVIGAGAVATLPTIYILYS